MLWTNGGAQIPVRVDASHEDRLLHAKDGFWVRTSSFYRQNKSWIYVGKTLT